MGVPGALYLAALSSRLSRSWPSSGGCAQTHAPAAGLQVHAQVAGAVVAGPVAQVRADERGELHRMEVGPTGLALGPRQEEQRLDDLPEPDGLLVDVDEGPPILLGRAVAPQRDLDLAEQGRQRRPELVRGVAGEPLLPLDLLGAAAGAGR